jgi:hypothetical protein
VFRNYHFINTEGNDIYYPPADELAKMNNHAISQIEAGIGKLKTMQLAAKYAVTTGETELPGSADGEEIVKRATKLEELHSSRRTPPNRQ